MDDQATPDAPTAPDAATAPDPAPEPGIDREAGAGAGADSPSRLDRWDALALGVVTLALLAPVAGLMRYQGPPMEEGFMLVFPEQILAGRLPHRDFLHLYGPGALYVLAGVFRVFGTHLHVERTVGLLQHAAVAYSLFFLLRPFGRRIATAGAVVSVVILIGPLGLSAMAWNGALAAGLAALVAAAAASRREGRPRTVLLVAAGVLGGVSLLYRPDLVLAVLLGLGAWWFQLPKGSRAPMLWGFLGTCALYVPHVLASGIEASFRGMFLEPVFELRGGRSLPIPPSWSEVDGFLQRAGTLRVTGWPLPMLEQSHQIHLWFWMVPGSIVVVLAGALLLRRREPGSVRALAFWPAALFGAALLQQAVQRPDTAHLSWVTGVTFPLMIAAVAAMVAARWPGRRDWVPDAAGIGVVAVLLVAVIPFYPVRTYADLVAQSAGYNRFGFPIERADRVFPFGSEGGAEAAQRVVDRLDELSTPGESLVVGPADLSRANYSDAFFYHLFPDLVPGTRYIEMDPGLADAEDSGLADELRATDWVILSEAWSDWDEPNDSAVGRSQEPNRVLEESFCVVEDAGEFRLLGRCDALR